MKKCGRLALKIKPRSSIQIGDDILIELVEASREVKIVITAPIEMEIHRIDEFGQKKVRKDGTSKE